MKFLEVCLTVTCNVMDTLPFSKEHGTEQLNQADSVMSCWSSADVDVKHNDTTHKS